jgi:hypothetical protein
VSASRLSLTKQDIQAECDSVSATLQQARDKLLGLSPDFDNLLGVNADPIGCADALSDMLQRVEDASRLIALLPSKPKPNKTQHVIAVEMATRVLSVAKANGMKISGSGGTHYGGTSSEAAKLLKKIGDEVGLSMAPLTWRNIISEVKKGNPNL